jgi:hypothetical protein
MGSDPQSWSPRSKDDVLADPQSFLADLGWASGPAARPVAAPPRRELRYCSFCWHVLPPGSRECAECGQSVEQMEAALQARVQADRTWIPPRMWKDGQAPSAPAPAPPGRLFQPAGYPAVAEAPLSAPLVLSWRHILMAVGIGGFVGGATVAAAWVALQTFGRPAGAGPLPGSPGSRAAALMPGRLTWKNPVAELRLELVSAGGTVVASNQDAGAPRPLDPGEYRLRVTDNSGKWAPPEERVLVAPGEAVTLGPTPQVAAGFYLWAGKKLYEEQKLDRAERVWRKAIRAFPQGAEAHLQLAALLAVQYRYQEARQEVQEVLGREPTHPDALQLLKTLDSLEKKS